MKGVNYKKIPDLGTMRVATPKTLYKIDNFQEYLEKNPCLKTPKPTLLLLDKGLSCIKYSKRNVSCNKIHNSRKNSFNNRAKDSLKSEAVSNSNIKYSEFKDFHFSSYKQKNEPTRLNFFSSYYKKNASNAKFKHPEIDRKEKNNFELHNIEDTFLKNTMYSKPAKTYGEKLFRLNQVSIFS